MAGNASVDWVLVVFALFKGLVFVTGMVLAVKWHFDREAKGADRRVLLRAGAKFAAAFMVLLLVLLGLTFWLAQSLGMDLRLP